MNYINTIEIKNLISTALREDIGSKDVTTGFILPKPKTGKAVIISKQDCIVCGLGVAATVFKTWDKNIVFKSLVKEGSRVHSGKIIASIKGDIRSILTAERTALNFLSLLCGIATKTNEYVRKIRPYKTKILDTRKTIPGLRMLEKYAVRIGGGFNHRSSLDEMVLVKDNHLKIVKSYKNLKNLNKNYQIELEIDSLNQFGDAIKVYPDIVMLDNMSAANVKKAVKLRNKLALNKANPKPKLEASGGINLKNIKKFASTKVDMISIGALTHSVASIDISLEII